MYLLDSETDIQQAIIQTIPRLNHASHRRRNRGGRGGSCPPTFREGGALPPQNPGPNDVTNQPDLSLFMIDTPRYSQKLLRIASKVDHCANFPSFLSSRQQ